MLNAVGWQFSIGAFLQNSLFERFAVPEIFVDMCSAWLLQPQKVKRCYENKSALSDVIMG